MRRLFLLVLLALSCLLPSVGLGQTTVTENFDSYVVVNGTSSGSNTSTTLNDTSKSWTVNAYSSGYFIMITSGTGAAQQRTISANTATQITVSSAWTTTPDSTSVYIISQKNTNWSSTSAGYLPFANTLNPISTPNSFGIPGAVAGGTSYYNQAWMPRTGSTASGDGCLQYTQKINYGSNSTGNCVAMVPIARTNSTGQNGYQGFIEYYPTGGVYMLFQNRASGTVTGMSNSTISAKTFASGTVVKTKMETQAYSASGYVELRMKVWAASGSEPGSWDKVYDDYGYLITAAGTGGTSGTYTLGISGGGGTGAAGTYTISGGGVTSITFTSTGSGYTSRPTLSFPSGSVSGAAATCFFDVNAGTVGPTYTGSYRGISEIFNGTVTAGTTVDATIDDYFEGAVGTTFNSLTSYAPNTTGVYFSPYNWVTGSTCITSTPGSYIKVAFTGQDLSLGTTQTTSTVWIRSQVDGGAFTDQQLNSGGNVSTIGSGLATGSHQATIWFLRSNTAAGTDKWGGQGGFATSGTTNTLTDTTQTWTVNAYAGSTINLLNSAGTVVATGTIASNTSNTVTISGTFSTTPAYGTVYAIPTTSGIPIESLTVTALYIDASASIGTATTSSNYAAVFGDSIVEGYNMTIGSSGYLANDAVYNWVPSIMAQLGCEFGKMGYDSEGLRQAAFNVPAFNASYAYIYNQQSRLTAGKMSPTPNYVFLEHGFNGSGVAAWYGSDYYQALVNLRAISGSNTKIFALMPFAFAAGSSKSGLRNEINATAQTGTATGGTTTTLTTGTTYSGINGQCIYITSGTGAGEFSGVASVSGGTITINQAWGTAPDATSHYAIAGGYTIYQLVNSDALTYLVDNAATLAAGIPGGGVPTSYSADGTHPLSNYMQLIGSTVFQSVNAILNPSTGGGENHVIGGLELFEMLR